MFGIGLYRLIYIVPNVKYFANIYISYLYTINATNSRIICRTGHTLQNRKFNGQIEMLAYMNNIRGYFGPISQVDRAATRNSLRNAYESE